MIVVRVELHSAATGKAQEIARMFICNKGDSADVGRGNYDVRVAHKSRLGDGMFHQSYAQPARTGEVRDYPRLSYNVWRLVCRALKSAFPEEK